MSWRDRLAQCTRATGANAISAKSAVSPRTGAFGTNSTIGTAEISEKTAAKRAVIGSVDENDLASDSGGRTDDQDECADRIEYRPGVPRAWAEGFARLDPDRPPSDVPLKRWQSFVDDVGQFLDGSFCATAAALGWGSFDLFGADRDRPFSRLDRQGLCWLINGGRLIGLSSDAAVIETRSGVRQTYCRKRSEPGRVLAWDLTNTTYAGAPVSD